MISEIKYNCLLEEFLSVAQSQINDSVLIVLKEYYAHYIHSTRKLSQVNNLKTLLKVLEKRDILSYSNVEPLAYISNNFLNDPCIQNKIKNYEFHLQNMKYSLFCNMYQTENASSQTSSKQKDNDKKELSNETENCTLQANAQTIEPECQLASQTCMTNSRTSSEQEAMLQQKVLLQISERIGRSWRDTVRYLGIPEYQIDIIQNKYLTDMKEQSYEALKLCISQYSTDNWKLNLIHALEKARRRDLKELAEKLIICTKID